MVVGPPLRRDTGRATAAGIAAILLWGTLALLTTATRGIPPFELLALSFGAASLLGFALLSLRRASWRRLQVPLPAWLLGFGGLFLYHALYFVALKSAPPAQASLIAYLWPLLIVLLAALVAGRRLSSRHLAGAVAGLAGTALLVLGHNTGTSGSNTVLGYVAAAGCALVWSGYSVLNQRFAGQPSEAIAGICGGVAIAGFAVHCAAEGWIMPTAAQWAAIAGLGLGPVGIAFFAWDHATKHGNLPLLGALSYLAPLLSTALLVITGRAPAQPSLGVAALLVVGGAAIAARPAK